MTFVLLNSSPFYSRLITYCLQLLRYLSLEIQMLYRSVVVSNTLSPSLLLSVFGLLEHWFSVIIIVVFLPNDFDTKRFYATHSVLSPLPQRFMSLMYTIIQLNPLATASSPGHITIFWIIPLFPSASIALRFSCTFLDLYTIRQCFHGLHWPYPNSQSDDVGSLC